MKILWQRYHGYPSHVCGLVYFLFLDSVRVFVPFVLMCFINKVFLHPWAVRVNYWVKLLWREEEGIMNGYWLSVIIIIIRIITQDWLSMVPPCSWLRPSLIGLCGEETHSLSGGSGFGSHDFQVVRTHILRPHSPESEPNSSRFYAPLIWNYCKAAETLS